VAVDKREFQRLMDDESRKAGVVTEDWRDVMDELVYHGSYLLGLAETLRALRGDRPDVYREAIEGFIEARERAHAIRRKR
jgi:hypothetical protein